MTTTYLIDITSFQRRTLLSQNINTDRLKADISMCQEKYVVKVLCQDLFDQIISQYPDLSAANQALLPYIQDFLIYKTYARYLRGANAVPTVAGPRIMSDTVSEKLPDSDMAALLSQAEGDANFFQDKLVNFLIKNQNTYTLWKDSVCNCSPNIRPLNQNRFSKVGNKITEKRIGWT